MTSIPSRGHLILGLLVVAALVAPTVGARKISSYEIAFTNASTTAWTGYVTWSGPDGVGIRARADFTGDWNVSEAELSVFRRTGRGVIASSENATSTLNDHSPVNTTVEIFSLDGLTGPVNQSNPVWLTFQGTDTYPQMGSHTRRYSQHPGESDELRLSVTVPRGWEIRDTKSFMSTKERTNTTVSGATVAKEAMTVEFVLARRFLVTPGPGAWLSISGTMAAVWLLRRN